MIATEQPFFGTETARGAMARKRFAFAADLPATEPHGSRPLVETVVRYATIYRTSRIASSGQGDRAQLERTTAEWREWYATLPTWARPIAYRAHVGG